MKNLVIIVVLILSTATVLICQSKGIEQSKEYPKSLADYSDFKNLVDEVEAYREKRLLNLDEFVKMSQEENVVILDSRSGFRFKRKHIKGAVHLGFSDFTQASLAEKLPMGMDTKILIYCNNNFKGDQVDFASKVMLPRGSSSDEQFAVQKKPIMLALNIPTFINLYGYGYRNVYELNELVDVRDARIKFEGTEVGSRIIKESGNLLIPEREK